MLLAVSGERETELYRREWKNMEKEMCLFHLGQDLILGATKVWLNPRVDHTLGQGDPPLCGNDYREKSMTPPARIS